MRRRLRLRFLGRLKRLVDGGLGAGILDAVVAVVDWSIEVDSRLAAAAINRDLADRAAEGAERLGQFGRDDPRARIRAVRDLRQRLQVLVRQQLLIGVSVVDRLENRLDRLRLALRPQDGGLPIGLRVEDGRLALALGREDLGLLLTLRGENR